MQQTSQYKYQTVNVDLQKRYGYSHIEDILKALSKSEIVKTFVIGESADNRKIYCLEIGTGKAVKMISAGTHARENSTPIFLLKYISELVNDYQNNKKYAIDYFAKNKLVVVPCVNPDGYLLTQWGKKILRNKTLYANCLTDEALKSLKANARGIDINRSFPSYLASAYFGNNKSNLVHTKPSLDFFAGYSLGSEPETKAMMRWMIKYIPLASVYVDLHQKGRVVYYGKSHLSNEYNIIAKDLANKIKEVTGYVLYTNTNDPIGTNSGGSTTDFAAEIASGFVYNATIKRLAPVETGNIKIYRYYKLKHKISICTPEVMIDTTINQVNRRLYEWDNKRLKDMFTIIANT